MSTPPSYLTPSRLAKRSTQDFEVICSILDEALFCTVSYSVNNRPFSIPTAFVRYEDKIYIHGSVGSHFIREIENGIPVCITVMLTDALVVAKSAFSHSVNYRSVVIFSNAEKVEDTETKRAAFEWLTNKIVPNSWDYLRSMKDSEVKKTTALAFSLEEACAKTRSGMPKDEEEDLELPIWSGLIPIQTKYLAPVPDELSQHIPLPKHLA
ncbi:pyridoxamine 5'-phosphate oxidase family protein [Dyadobacter chenwenxiniae]|uniref:Pyridoxamine 5'-phosphate oxidase family protein n=1 Tax=Dyadobacter chenwenxiniae TaxID=2906456 RepID=A0A9X1PNX3_9BACT|nr:pyridoxamine 5'-phosphate oxidase family protein [Dyadobacter chenwenxiniae]MCF0051948.1 pyridoxamine 5'-phosphate oxidase family protein [Dyadobacter chenwenxiniae]MCF0063479.1 pyridoxamine 5'-phosphate oxidase family protein [Dyadobacter chenwenxiniae]UON85142.1 pyridoxamine 5'-phosphate oxidase family protein [Dyadobacter chenwenxiniae]